MAREVSMSRNALRAFQPARDWLLQPGSKRQGARKWDAMRQVRRRLRDNPYIGSQDLGQPQYRAIVVSGYRIVYRVSPDTADSRTAGDVVMLRIFSPRQEANWP
jgi:plasmid stabilization system protein ParE